MKRLITGGLLIFALLIGGTAATHAAANELSASDIRLVRMPDGTLTVTFYVTADHNTVRRGDMLVMRPALENGNQSVELPEFTFDRRIRTPRSQQQPTTFAYSASLSYEEWMRGGRLVLRGHTLTCGEIRETRIGLLAENILYGEDTIDTTIVEVPLSTAETLARQFPFIVSNAEMEATRFDYDMPLDMGRGMTQAAQGEVERFIDVNRRGSLTVHFRQGSRTVERYFADNNRNLVDMVSAVRAIMESDDSSIVRIVLAGFASPEGSAAVNDRIAWERAVAMRDFLVANTGISPHRINIYNGGIDWAGLRQLVAESEMPDGERVIDIIDNTPAWDSGRNTGRHSELMRLGGGRAYQWMLHNLFPQLRNAAYIKVVYENK
ncbi:MAG: hypothetical protein FWE10_04825 [Rikenellaceae bacterium]|nr:hypothetical protein [Rikenellaceae bacterium]MCL2691924.1 hypothetical protein [Rikenellaceae bacterium]